MDKWLPPTRSYHFNQPKRPHIFAWLDRSVTIGLAAKLSEVWRKLNQSTPQTTTNISQGVTRHYTTLRFTFALSGTCCSHRTIQSSGLNYIVPSTTSQPPQSTSFQNPIPNHIRFPTRYYIEKKKQMTRHREIQKTNNPNYFQHQIYATNNHRLLMMVSSTTVCTRAQRGLLRWEQHTWYITQRLRSNSSRIYLHWRKTKQEEDSQHYVSQTCCFTQNTNVRSGQSIREIKTG